MHLMTSLQLLLLLLSALRGMFAFRYHSYDFNHRPHQYGRSPTSDNCHEQSVISRWINEQVIRHAKITQFNQRLSELLDALNGNNTKSKDDGFCCFYEKETMDKLFKDITILSKKYDIVGGAQLQKTGDIGQDLDLILDRMKNLVHMDMKSCCDRLSKNLMELESDFKKQLEDLHNKVIEKNNAKGTTGTEFKDNQKDLDKRLNQLKLRIEKLEQKQKDNAKGLQDGKCCKEIDNKLNELNKQLEEAKADTENKTTTLEKEIKDLKDKQKEQESKIKHINEELEKRAKNMKKVIEKCEKNCNNEQNVNESNAFEYKTTNKTSNSDNDISKRLDNLEQLIQHLIDNHKKLNGTIETLAQCHDLKNNLTKIEEKLSQVQELKNNNNQSNCQTDQITKSKELEPEIEKAKDCCKNIENLAKDSRDLNEKIIQMNESYIDHISNLDGEIEDLHHLLNEALEKIEQESSKFNNIKTKLGFFPYYPSNWSNNQKFEEKLDVINKNLELTEKTLNDNDNKLNNLHNESMKNFDELNQLVADQKNAAQEFNKNAEKRYDNLSAQNNNSKSADKDDRLNRLEKQQDQLSEDIDKALQLEKRVEDLEKQLKDAFDSGNSTQLEVGKCISRCKYLDKIDDLIDRIEDLEEKSSGKSSKGQGQQQGKKNDRQSAIGGVDYK
ncbi:putative leucine-rich repeat-containing protein DDB_G0290503 [Drosophila innubila]|uniref:putative leucine-rich repeat-containing protein DDB_G0290503 n=1 Tax=Drosophila innubila TaxID=198719 RepID=UPI00148BBFB9|nr:putative leucine-rich repeat-containing protein DDB_G0290503 [Drosophila innubila]